MTSRIIDCQFRPAPRTLSPTTTPEPLSTAARARARTGIIKTPHGIFHTPAFMPVATRGAIRGVLSHHLASLGCEIALANAFHLYLRPGDEHVLNTHGDIRRFMGWDGPVLTDSGGYQVFSLANMRTVSENGLRFRSPYDGAYHDYTPELVVRIQANLGSTFMMQLDELIPPDQPFEAHKNAVERTLRWYERAIKAHDAYPHAGLLVPILQGGCFHELREYHLDRLLAMTPDMPMIAIGGLAVGESTAEFNDTLAALMPLIPKDKLVYLMGIGRPEDVLTATALGVDIVDCVLPTRNGRNGQVFTFQGRYNIRNSQYQHDSGPLEDGCNCPICQRYSKSFIHHLFRVGEMNGPIAVSTHNLFYFFQFFSKIRRTIHEGDFDLFRTDCERQQALVQLDDSLINPELIKEDA